uniref:Liver-expressed antimicrobial peptide 2 n=1 Tax=Denticeps clupeoides TaxID=299321 RepID=A0AAY4D6F4_9TELE
MFDQHVLHQDLDSGELWGGAGNHKRRRQQRSEDPERSLGYRMEKVGTWLLVTLLLLQQVKSKNPVTSPADAHPDTWTLFQLRRQARMTPLWRILGSKPKGAHCKSHYECISLLCRSGAATAAASETSTLNHN